MKTLRIRLNDYDGKAIGDPIALDVEDTDIEMYVDERQVFKWRTSGGTDVTFEIARIL